MQSIYYAERNKEGHIGGNDVEGVANLRRMDGRDYMPVLGGGAGKNKMFGNPQKR